MAYPIRKLAICLRPLGSYPTHSISLCTVLRGHTDPDLPVFWPVNAGYLQVWRWNGSCVACVHIIHPAGNRDRTQHSMVNLSGLTCAACPQWPFVTYQTPGCVRCLVFLQTRRTCSSHHYLSAGFLDFSDHLGLLAIRVGYNNASDEFDPESD